MSSSGFGAQLVERLKGVFVIVLIVTAGFLTYPPLLAFGIVACAADEFYRVARQQRRNVNTYAQETLTTPTPAVAMTTRIIVGTVTHRAARLHQGKRAAYVALCVGISAASLVSFECMTFVALALSFALLVCLMAEVERRRDAAAGACGDAAEVKLISAPSAAAASAASSVASADSSPPPPSLLLHPSSPLLSAHEFCAVLVLIVGLWYTGWMFSHGVLVLRHPSGFTALSGSTAAGGSAGSALVNSLGVSRIVYVIFVTAGGENGGLFFGKLFGRHKLCRRISPGKTVEGALGQLATSLMVSALFRCYVEIDLPLLDSLLLGLLLGLVGCVGDLFESFLKRSIGIKDAGHLIPGVGGMLDRMDGLIFNFPVMYAYLQMCK